MNSFRGFLQYIHTTMPVDNDFVQPPERHGDVHIMDYAINCGHFDKAALHILNCCRLYLHVTTVSELFNATGQHMLPHTMFECTKPPCFNPATIVTLQRRPSEYQIRYPWKRLCREWSKSDGTIAESITLGPWPMARAQQPAPLTAINIFRELLAARHLSLERRNLLGIHPRTPMLPTEQAYHLDPRFLSNPYRSHCPP
jgi:hypothetical protein